jgi:hypothetical protein
VRALALPAKQAEELDWFDVRGAEPVRYPGIELGRLSRRQHQIVFTEHDPKTSVEDIKPFIALVGLRLGFAAGAGGWYDELVRLDAARASGQRNHRHAVPRDWP